MSKLYYFLVKIGVLVLLSSMIFVIFPFFAEQGDSIGIKNGEVYTYKEFQYSKKEVANVIYSNKKVPDGFYYEDWEGWIYYVSNEINGEWDFYSTDNLTEARIVVEQYLQNSPYHPNNIVSSRETEKYFEFMNEETKYSPVTQENYTIEVPFRVHKESYIFLYNGIYFDWGTDLKLGTNTSYNIGRFNQYPINQSNVRELCEYLWFINNYNVHGHKVIDSRISEANSSIYYKLLETHFCGGDWGLYDFITLVYSIYTINTSSGEIFLFKEAFDHFQGRYNAQLDEKPPFIIPIMFLISILIIFGILFWGDTTKKVHDLFKNRSKTKYQHHY